VKGKANATSNVLRGIQQINSASPYLIASEPFLVTLDLLDRSVANSLQGRFPTILRCPKAWKVRGFPVFQVRAV
jgi:hypothetical protein